MATMEQLQLDYLQDGAPRAFHYRAGSRGDEGVIQQIFRQRDYDLAPFALAAALRRYRETAAGGRRPLIVDAGANIGASAVFFACEHPGAVVAAVEPEPNNFALLLRNCEGLPVTALRGAVGCEPGRQFLFDPGEGDWGFRVQDRGDLPVEVLAMDELVASFPEEQHLPLICKVDIEGGEAALFARRTGWMDRFPLLILELHDWMLPGEANSRSFRRALLDYDFDFVLRGENVFCFNNRLLRAHR